MLQIEYAVSQVIANGCFNFSQGFVWVGMGNHAHFITPVGWKVRTGRVLYHSQICMFTLSFLNRREKDSKLRPINSKCVFYFNYIQHSATR